MLPTHFKLLFGMMGRYRIALALIVALGVMESLLEGVGIGLLIPFFDVAMGGVASGESVPFLGLVDPFLSGLDQQQRLLVIGLVIALLIMLKCVVIYLHVFVASWANTRICQHLRLALVGQVLELGYPFLARRGQNRVLNTLDLHVWRTGEALSSLFLMIVNACTILVFAVLLAVISWQLALAMGVGVLAASVLLRVLTRRANRLSQRAVAAYNEIAARVLELLNGLKVITAFGQEAAEHARFHAASERLRRTVLRMELVAGMVHPLIELLYVPLLVGAVLVALATGHGLPTLLAFLLLFYRMQPQIKQFERHRVEIANASAALQEIADLLRHDDQHRLRSGTTRFERLKRDIAFERVSFRYHGSNEVHPALHDLSFRIDKGSVTAIVGGSGAGKSTVVNLLYRFFDPVTGRIVVDGVPLPELHLASWRGRLAWAGQDSELMSGTVADNIGFGRPGASRAEIIAAARQADAHDFITRLPAGYDTEIGPRGLSLSGGQRQRIGLARALLRAPEILILDEATNALDSLSEAAIQRTIARLAGRATVIVVAHRLSSIRSAGHVLVLHDGHLVEQGTPAELLERNGRFAELYDRRSGLEAPPQDRDVLEPASAPRGA